VVNDVAMKWCNRSSAAINITLQLLVIYRYRLEYPCHHCLQVVFPSIVVFNIMRYIRIEKVRKGNRALKLKATTLFQLIFFVFLKYPIDLIAPCINNPQDFAKINRIMLQIQIIL